MNVKKHYVCPRCGKVKDSVWDDIKCPWCHTPMVEERVYHVEDVISAGYTLEPLECKFCGSRHVIFDQYIGDAYCEECGRWQTES